MIKCPYCAEEIQPEAIKCRYCLEFLDGSRPSGESQTSKPKWYFTTTALVVGILSLGPFALPFVWAHPTYRMATKILITLAVLAFSVWAFIITRDLLRNLTETMKQLNL